MGSGEHDADEADTDADTVEEIARAIGDIEAFVGEGSVGHNPCEAQHRCTKEKQKQQKRK